MSLGVRRAAWTKARRGEEVGGRHSLVIAVKPATASLDRYIHTIHTYNTLDGAAVQRELFLLRRLGLSIDRLHTWLVGELANWRIGELPGLFIFIFVLFCHAVLSGRLDTDGLVDARALDGAIVDCGQWYLCRYR